MAGLARWSGEAATNRGQRDVAHRPGIVSLESSGSFGYDCGSRSDNREMSNHDIRPYRSPYVPGAIARHEGSVDRERYRMIRKSNVKALNLASWSAALATVMPLVSNDVSAQTGGLSVTDVTLVTGSPDMVDAAALIASLKGGDLVAGRTRWDHDGDGVVFGETRVGFLWSPANGAQPFEISESDYFEPQFHTPTDISPNGTVVGWRQYTLTLQLLPFAFTASHGFQNLPFPEDGGPPLDPSSAGQAVAISFDGSVIVGRIQPDGPFSDAPTIATVWTLTEGQINATFIETVETWSHAKDVSSDGSVIVGDAGPSATELAPKRWGDESAQPLEIVGNTGSARFTSEDGSTAIGFATVAEQGVLVQWDGGGSASVFAPPAGSSVKRINAINPDATAAAGVLVTDDPDSPFGENWAPFVWTPQNGIEVIPENGRPEEYDLSEALGISDDGNIVVGTFRASVVFEGEPPTLGFIWVRGTGIVLLNDLMAAARFPDPDYWRVDAVSGDGLRLLATGNPPGQTIHDTNSAIIQLRNVGPGKPIPATSTWGLVLTALGFVFAGTLAWRRRPAR